MELNPCGLSATPEADALTGVGLPPLKPSRPGFNPVITVLRPGHQPPCRQPHPPPRAGECPRTPFLAQNSAPSHLPPWLGVRGGQTRTLPSPCYSSPFPMWPLGWSSLPVHTRAHSHPQPHSLTLMHTQPSHTHNLSHTHTQSCTLAYSQHSVSRTCSQSHSVLCTHAHSVSDVHTVTHSYTLAQVTVTLSLTVTCTHSPTLIHTHTQSHTCTLSLTHSDTQVTHTSSHSVSHTCRQSHSVLHTHAHTHSLTVTLNLTQSVHLHTHSVSRRSYSHTLVHNHSQSLARTHTLAASRTHPQVFHTRALRTHVPRLIRVLSHTHPHTGCAHTHLHAHTHAVPAASCAPASPLFPGALHRPPLEVPRPHRGCLHLEARGKHPRVSPCPHCRSGWGGRERTLGADCSACFL